MPTALKYTHARTHTQWLELDNEHFECHSVVVNYCHLSIVAGFCLQYFRGACEKNHCILSGAAAVIIQNNEWSGRQEECRRRQCGRGPAVCAHCARSDFELAFGSLRYTLATHTPTHRYTQSQSHA